MKERDPTQHKKNKNQSTALTMKQTLNWKKSDKKPKRKKKTEGAQRNPIITPTKG